MEQSGNAWLARRVFRSSVGWLPVLWEVAWPSLCHYLASCCLLFSAHVFKGLGHRLLHNFLLLLYVVFSLSKANRQARTGMHQRTDNKTTNKGFPRHKHIVRNTLLFVKSCFDLELNLNAQSYNCTESMLHSFRYKRSGYCITITRIKTRASVISY